MGIWIILAPVALALIAFFFIAARDMKKNKQSAQQKLASKGASVMVTLPHTAGLPVPEKTPCELFYCDGHIEINGNGIQFTLDFSKIHDICIKTSTEIHKQLVSSAGGAIGGARLFGTLGALIFGRVKERQITNTRHYLIFTYSKDSGDIDYIGFEVEHQNRYVNYFVDEFSKRPQNVRSVIL